MATSARRGDCLIRCAIALLIVTLNAPAQSSCTLEPVGGGVYINAVGPGVVYAANVFDDGTGPALYIGGEFTTVGGSPGSGGVPAYDIARWDGANLGPIGNPTPAAGQSIRAMTVFDDGTGPALYVGGTFWTQDGIPAAGIARWDGSTFTEVGGGVAAGPSGFTVLTLRVFEDGSGPALYMGGIFQSAGGNSCINIARWDGTSWSPVDGGLGGWTYSGVTELVVGDTGSGPSLFAVGTFTTAGTTPVNAVARWDGTTWHDVGGGIANPTSVRGAAFHDDGNGPALWCVGDFLTAGGQPATRIAKWDGVSWSAPGNGAGLSFSGYTAHVHDDGSGPHLFIGGQFWTVNGQPIDRVARWDGTTFSELAPGITGIVDRMASFDDGTGQALYLCGAQSTTLPFNGLARWRRPTAGLSLSATQPGGAGSTVWIHNANLIPGHTYLNLFSFEPCPGSPGTGPGPFGACLTSPANIAFVASQALSPVGTPPFHLRAWFGSATYGPFTLPPLTVDALCIDDTGGVFGSNSGVIRLSTR